MRIGIVARRVLQQGGMERAAAEVVKRFAKVHDVSVLSTSCDVTSPRLTWVPAAEPRGPATVRNWGFDRVVRGGQHRLGADVTNSVGAIVAGVDVITAHFCQSAFRAKYGGIRGAGDTMRGWYHGLADRIDTYRERRAYTFRMLRAVIAVSQGLKRELMEHHRLPDERIVVIPNGVDHTIFRPAPTLETKQRLRSDLGLPQSALVCLFVGGDWERKGLGYAVRAVAGVPDVLLVVVGRGDTERFQALAQSAGASRQVIFAGLSLTPERYFAAADLYVFPSHYEAFPLSPLEAAAAGLPVLAPRLNGLEEWLVDGLNGYLVEREPASIRARMVALRDDSATRMAMAHAAVRSSQMYSWEDVAARQLRVLETVAAGHAYAPNGRGSR